MIHNISVHIKTRIQNNQNVSSFRLKPLKQPCVCTSSLIWHCFAIEGMDVVSQPYLIT